jgi:endonuclease YncB( thermonuclease family)
MSIGNPPILPLPHALSLAALSLFLALANPSLADDVNIVGHPGITDGDTIRIAGTRIRLHGIDSPERDQSCVGADGQAYACGVEATKALADFIGGRGVDCLVRDTDRYGRSVAVCQVGGVDVGGWMVSSGWAVAYRRYSMDYVDEEDRARAARCGLWAGSFDNPWDWRRTN